MARFAEEIGEGENAQAPPPRLPRSRALASIASLLPASMRSSEYSPSSSPSQSPAKLVEKDSLSDSQADAQQYARPDAQPPPVPTNWSDDQGAPTRQPPSPPPQYSQVRSSSAPRPEQRLSRRYSPDPASRLQPRAAPNAVAAPVRRERSVSLAPPVPHNGGQDRVATSPVNSRPTSYHSDQEGNRAGRLKKRRSWLKSSRSRPTSQDMDLAHFPAAWVEMDGQKLDYNLACLTDGLAVSELFADSKENPGDTFVYLFPQDAGCPAQFKIHSPAVASSSILHGLLFDDSASINSSRRRARSFDGRHTLAIEDATRNYNAQLASPPTRNFPFDNHSTPDESNGSIRSSGETPRQFHLYFPTNLSSSGPPRSAVDIQRLVDVRNLFALLEGQVLVNTRAVPTRFHVLLSVASMLQEFEFTNSDGSTFGEEFSTAFEFFLNNGGFGDVSYSQEKTIEGVILGERMRSLGLYSEAFAHAVGTYEAVQAVSPSLFSQVSSNTRKRLDRAFLDLGQRQRTAELRLTEFVFPSLFAGIATSTSSEESKFVHFKAWKSHFFSLRKFVLSYYKDLHGQWPPKASSKKNSFARGGLNRLVLKGLYIDFCALYDLLADREAITTRGINASEDRDTANVGPTATALRHLLAEFDRSSPPVTPPIPFDIPLIPTMATSHPKYYGMGPKDQHTLANTKLKDPENKHVIAKSHNPYTQDFKMTAFLDAYETFEAKETKGKSCLQMADIRYGHWIFMYAVLQSLPMLTVDAPGLRHTTGVEYFLCEPPMGNPPWMEDTAVKREWYGVASSGHAVVLPSDLVVHGVEGIYDRSYCWIQARKWIGPDTADSTQGETTEVDRTGTLSPLPLPPGFTGGELGVQPRSRTQSRSSIGSESPVPENRGRNRQSQRNSIAIGLERLPIPIRPASGSPSLQATSSRGQSPVNSNVDIQGRRASSSGPSGVDAYRGSTFDDILGSMTSQDPKQGGRGSGLMGRFK